MTIKRIHFEGGIPFNPELDDAREIQLRNLSKARALSVGKYHLTPTAWGYNRHNKHILEVDEHGNGIYGMINSNRSFRCLKEILNPGRDEKIVFLSENMRAVVVAGRNKEHDKTRLHEIVFYERGRSPER